MSEWASSPEDLSLRKALPSATGKPNYPLAGKSEDRSICAEKKGRCFTHLPSLINTYFLSLTTDIPGGEISIHIIIEAFEVAKFLVHVALIRLPICGALAPEFADSSFQLIDDYVQIIDLVQQFGLITG